MSVEQILLYSLVIFSVSIVPGPSTMLAFRDGAAYNVIGTMPSALGNMVASLVQALIALLMLRSIFEMSPDFLSAVQYIGAAFICYIGFIFIRDGRRMRIGAGKDIRTPIRSEKRRFADGFLVAFFNPKAVLFFVALFPQFTGNMRIRTVLDLMQVFAPIGLIAVFCFMLYGVLGQFSRAILDEETIFGTIVPIMGAGMILITVYVSVF